MNSKLDKARKMVVDEVVGCIHSDEGFELIEGYMRGLSGYSDKVSEFFDKRCSFLLEFIGEYWWRSQRDYPIGALPIPDDFKGFLHDKIEMELLDDALCMFCEKEIALALVTLDDLVDAVFEKFNVDAAMQVGHKYTAWELVDIVNKNIEICGGDHTRLQEKTMEGDLDHQCNSSVRAAAAQYGFRVNIVE